MVRGVCCLIIRCASWCYTDCEVPFSAHNSIPLSRLALTRLPDDYRITLCHTGYKQEQGRRSRSCQQRPAQHVICKVPLPLSLSKVGIPQNVHGVPLLIPFLGLHLLSHTGLKIWWTRGESNPCPSDLGQDPIRHLPHNPAAGLSCLSRTVNSPMIFTSQVR